MCHSDKLCSCCKSICVLYVPEVNAGVVYLAGVQNGVLVFEPASGCFVHLLQLSGTALFCKNLFSLLRARKDKFSFNTINLQFNYKITVFTVKPQC